MLRQAPMGTTDEEDTEEIVREEELQMDIKEYPDLEEDISE
jgi:hypothetical protein